MATIRLYFGWNFENTPEGVTRLFKRQTEENHVYWLLDDRTRIDRDTDGRLYFRLADVDAPVPPNLESLVEEVTLHDYPRGIVKTGRYEQQGAVAHIEQPGNSPIMRIRGVSIKSVIDLYWAILEGRLESSASPEK